MKTDFTIIKCWKTIFTIWKTSFHYIVLSFFKVSKVYDYFGISGDFRPTSTFRFFTRPLYVFAVSAVSLRLAGDAPRSLWPPTRVLRLCEHLCGHSALQQSREINEIQWKFIDFQWFSLIFIDFLWFSLIFIDFHWISLNFIDFRRFFGGVVAAQVARTAGGHAWVAARTTGYRPQAVGTPQTPRVRNADAWKIETWR